MGFEPTTLRDLVGCSNHWATGDSTVSKGQFMGLDWNRITRLTTDSVMMWQRDAVSEFMCAMWTASRI